MLDTKVGAGDGDPAEVARQGFEALMDGKERVVSASLVTKLQARGGRLLPDGAKAEPRRSWPSSGPTATGRGEKLSYALLRLAQSGCHA